MSNPNVNAIPTARSRMNVRTLVSLAMLTGIAYVVMLLSCSATRFLRNSDRIIEKK